MKAMAILALIVVCAAVVWIVTFGYLTRHQRVAHRPETHQSTVTQVSSTEVQPRTEQGVTMVANVTAKFDNSK